jgi:exonuclease V gamma subunit
MFTVDHSNRLEVLTDQLAHSRAPADRLAHCPRTIVVQSLGMARWLSLRNTVG